MFKQLQFTPVVHEEIQVRNNREFLIQQIVNLTNETNKKALAARIAISANQLGWTDTDLHALLKKRQDPSIRNFSAFVKWSIKITHEKTTTT